MESPFEIVWTAERVTAAREAFNLWHGTKFGDRMAMLGVGIDCINFVHEILVAAGVVERRRFTGYKTTDGQHEPSDRLRRVFEHCLFVERAAVTVPAFGDIIIFKTGQRSGHSAIFDDFEDEGRFWHVPANHFVTRAFWKIWKNEVDCLLRIVQCGWRNDPQTAVKL